MFPFLIENIVGLNRIEKRKDSSNHKEPNCIEMDNGPFLFYEICILLTHN